MLSLQRGVPQQIEDGLLTQANQTMYALPFARSVLTHFNESYKLVTHLSLAKFQSSAGKLSRQANEHT